MNNGMNDDDVDDDDDDNNDEDNDDGDDEAGGKVHSYKILKTSASSISPENCYILCNLMVSVFSGARGTQKRELES